jgi:hypothetical protein
MLRDDGEIRVLYSFRDGAHAFRAGQIQVAHGEPQVAYAAMTAALGETLSQDLGRAVAVLPRLSFADFWTWLRMNPGASLPGAACQTEFAWALQE